MLLRYAKDVRARETMPKMQPLELAGRRQTPRTEPHGVDIPLGAAPAPVTAPEERGTRPIRALDGLRGLAALGVLVYHAYFTAVASGPFVLGVDLRQWWYVPFYGQTGVDLFFVLSGFLLFLPYARALLDGRPLPATRRFFARRAQRILPVYLVCIAVLVAVQWPQYDNALGAADVGAHLLFLHDAIPPFNNGIDGVMWTLALEGQFYLLLPVAAALFGRAMGGSRSAVRLCALIGGFILAALALRELGAAMATLAAGQQGGGRMVAQVGTLLLIGTQGKFFEVFGLGMLSAVVYLLVAERRRLPFWAGAALGVVLFTAAIGSAYVLGGLFRQHVLHPVIASADLRAGDVPALLTPLALGLSYAALLLGCVLAPRIIRAPFEGRTLGAIGLISYSLYLWHGPAVWGMLPGTSQLAMLLRVVVSFALAALSYVAVERWFLARRGKAEARPKPAVEASTGTRQLAPTA